MLGAFMSTSKNTPSRRGMLAALGLTSAAAASLSVLPRQAAEPAEAAVAPPKKAPANGGGYALTEHVKRYYKTTLV